LIILIVRHSDQRLSIKRTNKQTNKQQAQEYIQIVHTKTPSKLIFKVVGMLVTPEYIADMFKIVKVEKYQLI
jgi:hypothetical protein